MKNLGSILLAVCLWGVPVLTAMQPVGARANGGEEEKPEDDPNRPHYVKISPIVVPVISDKGIEQTISLIVALEVKDKKTADDIIKISPRLSNAFLQDLYGAIDRKYLVRSGVVDVSRVKLKLEKAANRVLGDGMVQSVLVQAVSQRPVS